MCGIPQWSIRISTGCCSFGKTMVSVCTSLCGWERAAAHRARKRAHVEQTENRGMPTALCTRNSDIFLSLPSLTGEGQPLGGLDSTPMGSCGAPSEYQEMGFYFVQPWSEPKESISKHQQSAIRSLRLRCSVVK